MSKDILEVFRYYLENTTDTITASDCDSWLQNISWIQDMLKERKLEHTLRELAFIQFFLPDVDSFSIETDSQYDDEGGTYEIYSGTSISTGHMLLDRMMYHWGYAFYEDHDERYIDLQETNQEYVASLKHPLLSLFEEYTPKDEQAWGNLWTLFRSLKFEDFTQACTLLEGYIEGDTELREALRTAVFDFDIFDSLQFGCGGWWMILYLDPKWIDGENVDGCHFDMLTDNPESCFYMGWTAPNIFTQTVFSKIYSWGHRAITLCEDAYHDSKEEDLVHLKEAFEDYIW